MRYTAQLNKKTQEDIIKNSKQWHNKFVRNKLTMEEDNNLELWRTRMTKVPINNVQPKYVLNSRLHIGKQPGEAKMDWSDWGDMKQVCARNDKVKFRNPKKEKDC